MPPRNNGVLLGVTAWRVTIAVCAFIGFSQYVHGRMINLAFMTNQGNLATAVVYGGLALYPLLTGGQRHEPASAWIRGVMCVMMTLVSVTYLTMMSGSLDQTKDLFSHFITPLLVLADFLFVGRNQLNSPWWHPLTWPVGPVAYIVFYIAYDPGFREKYGRDIYEFLDPRDGSFYPSIMGFLVGQLVFAYAIWGVAMVRKASARQAGQLPHPPQPQYYNQYPPQYQPQYAPQPQYPRQYPPQQYPAPYGQYPGPPQQPGYYR